MFEQNEIKFFEEETYTNKPPNSDDHVACSTPNPPRWCNQDDSNAVSIDMYLVILVIAAILIRLNFKK